MLVGECFVKAAGVLGHPNPGHFSYQGRVGEPGHIEYDCSQVGIRATALVLE